MNETKPSLPLHRKEIPAKVIEWVKTGKNEVVLNDKELI